MPAARELDAEIVFAGEERADHVGPLQKQPLPIALLHLESEGNAREPDGEHDVRHRVRRRKARVHLRDGDARDRAAHRVAVELQHAAGVAIVTLDAQPRAPHQEARVVERLPRRIIQLVGRGLIVGDGVDLHEARGLRMFEPAELEEPPFTLLGDGSAQSFPAPGLVW